MEWGGGFAAEVVGGVGLAFAPSRSHQLRQFVHGLAWEPEAT